MVIDASVVAGWLLEDEQNPYSDAVADEIMAGVQPQAPNLLLWEIGNLLLMAEKRGRLKAGVGESLLARLSMLPWEWETPGNFLRMDTLLALGRKHGLTSYDAAYLSLAADRRVPLATLDAALRKAAKKAGVEVYCPD